MFLASIVEKLYQIQIENNLQLTYQLYCFIYSRINHCMWIEQWNSVCGDATNSKMKHKTATTLSRMMNIYVNGPILSKIDLREPALKYTLEVARYVNVSEKAKEQPLYDKSFF